MADLIACPFLLAPRGMPLLCDLHRDSVTGYPREIQCVVGIGGTCPMPGLREAEIRRRERERRANRRGW